VTTPISHGYPDYGRYAAIGDKLLYHTAGAVIAAPLTPARMFVADVPYLAVGFVDSNNNADVTITFWTDATAGVLLGTFAFAARAGTLFQRTIPTQGPWVEFTIAPQGGNLTFTLTVSTAANTWANQNNSRSNALITKLNENVNAGVTEDWDGAYISPGQAFFYGEHASATVEIRLVTVDALGNEVPILRQPPTVLTMAQMVFLPAEMPRIKLINGSAAVQLFHAFLTARPIGPGW